MGPDACEAVIRAADATCVLLAGDQQAILAGPEGAAFGPHLQWEYLSLRAVLITGRTNHQVVPLPTSDGTPGRAVVEGHIHRDPDTRQDLRTRIVAHAHNNAGTAAALEHLRRHS
ncbi:hypothetical protein AB0D66_26545 [Streptomyces sp. NPDC048270]|uniref:hypothetical protein n=1 Tax=Streptomyces sp. NPDC048270 TaxID=3154615 RepID=UPI0034002172